MSKTPQGFYPKQGSRYPTTQQPAYPTHPQPTQFSGGYALGPQPPAGSYLPYGAQGPYGVPPPAYSESAPGPGSISYNVVPQQVTQPYQSMAPTGYPTQQYAMGQYPAQGLPPNVIHGSFDSGARFSAGAAVNVPPPPPGYAPNAAQLASSQGQPVNVQQRQAGWFSGGTGGGYTFW